MSLAQHDNWHEFATAQAVSEGATRSPQLLSPCSSAAVVDGSDGSFFVKITEAYNVLIDPDSRARYNIEMLAGSLQDYEEYECEICFGKGSKTEKVKYGKYKVDSEIVCTNCNGSGIINNQT